MSDQLQKEKDKTENLVPRPYLGEVSETLKAVANIEMMKNFQAVVTEHITSPFDVLTPKEKVKKRLDGYDYVESSWMDKSFKTHSPLYSSELLHYSENMGWVTAIVKVTDRVTGNSELGGSSVRIQVKQGTLEPTFRDIIDKGNNVAAVITRAIKNAQSRFGHSADIYGKRESVRTEDEKQRFTSMLNRITIISKDRARLFQEQWNGLGTDYTEFLEKWQIYIDRNKTLAEADSDVRRSPSVSEAEVTKVNSHIDQVKASNPIAEKIKLVF